MSIPSAIATSAHRRVTVSTTDGVALAVREYGPRDGDLTVVLLHGHCLRTESWTDVRDALLRRYTGARIVCYDHRGHGDSASASRRTYTLERLGADLREVLDAVAPTGPVVLVGHSMGGMTALTYVSRNPHEIGTRIVGVALVATAASGLADAGFGRLLRNPAVSVFQAAVRRAPTAMQHAKLAACTVFAPVIRFAEFGDREVSARVLALANAMRNQTPIVTMAGFLSAFVDYDRTDALALLSTIPTLVLCGSADLMTPPSHSIAMAAAVDYADLVVVEGAGHSVLLEQPRPVADAIARLLNRVDAAAGIHRAGSSRQRGEARYRDGRREYRSLGAWSIRLHPSSSLRGFIAEATMNNSATTTTATITQYKTYSRFLDPITDTPGVPISNSDPAPRDSTPLSGATRLAQNGGERASAVVTTRRTAPRSRLAAATAAPRYRCA